MTDPSPSSPPPLTAAQRFRLLEIARDALTAQVRRSVRLPVSEPDLRLAVRQGVFATLTLGDRVRGCIGVLDAPAALAQTVADIVVSAATEDPREAPLRPDEVGRIDIELSVLSARVVVRPQDVEVGRHGLLIQQGRAVGVLLPQVAPQFGWTRDQFLDQAALRAGLPADAWRDASTRLEAFTAEVFAESGLRRA